MAKFAKRENLKALAMLAVGGIGSSILSAKKAVAQADSVPIVAAIEEWVRVYNESVQKINEIRKTANTHLEVIKTVADIDKHIKDQLESLKNTLDKYYKLKDDPLGGTIPNLDAKTLPLLKFVHSSIDFYDRHWKRANKDGKKTNRKANLSNQMKFDSGLSFAKAAAFEQRRRITQLKKAVKSTSHKNQTIAQTYAKEAAPITSEQFQLLLESQLRVEEMVNHFYTQILLKQPTKGKDFSKENYEKALKAFKDGDGTLADITGA